MPSNLTKDAYDMRAILLLLQLEREVEPGSPDKLKTSDINGARVDLLRAVLGAKNG